METGFEAWEPECKEDTRLVRAELEAVLMSSQFSNSKRYPALLKYVVESTLAGRADTLKERTLGIEVFGRAPDYDTSADTIVRYTASEVRRRLLLHYREHPATHGVQIRLSAGSYVPSFVHETSNSDVDSHALKLEEPGLDVTTLSANVLPIEIRPVTLRVAQSSRKRRTLIWCIALALVVAAATFNFVRHSRITATQAFWAPVFRASQNVLLCSGGVVFDEKTFSGVQTADKNTQYPFVSLQIASSLAQVSGILQRGGSSYRLVAATSTPLTDLREGAVVFFGAYNNPWTLRLVAPLRLHFAVPGDEQIVDSDHPGQSWTRDTSRGYGNGDDYALVARFHDPTTGSLAVVLAGLGRNGTEAAAQFVGSEQSLALLRQKLGSSFEDRNIEVLLKVSVVDGRTGAPTIVTTKQW